ncbi:MAG TPA: iron-sulfur cluster assembly scaffold protein [Candidatus Portnoybacteria bacterium]|jgi:nitrogen fixation protein NifU and related proteins|nr:iron-sulfur cluster assembly scaffold protein [Candidatus Portnoybacteria bacterium]MDD5752032.1 iron-sulfur cluster assembly scaffold protein [Candidatus Portnoybacteria bacterium]HNU96727.1 iron-sulfur cluster assembly scaffold protein [Candidatus Portnoybacteria bacterium]HOZ16382.1 iron-sulfur cluster assembly scaffold protein [Candidatus Portnoybacteria bacterium]HPH52068.1 iron-sulfur cluster assembly scaffold protein [Candidatus Portnoybacteria bacterium]
MSIYNKKIMEHFTNPKFFGKIKDADVIGKAGNPRCGDLLTLYLKINPKNKTITDIKFETLGCASAIASSDMICKIAKGKTMEEALKIGFQDVSNRLGTLPPLKIHCAQLVTEALKDAINKNLLNA